jgi:hypothetical protein
MGDHAAYTESNRHPVSPRLGPPTVQEIPKDCVDHGKSESPQSHLRLLDTPVASSEMNHDLVRESPCGPTYDIANQGS